MQSLRRGVWGMLFPHNQVSMNGDTFSIKAPKECSKKFVATLKGNSLPEEMFLEYSFVLRRIWGASMEKASPLKLL